MSTANIKLMNKPLLQEKYEKEVVPLLQKEFGLKNRMAVPKIEKVVVNVGLGEVLTNKNLINIVSKQLAVICGQKPQTTVAKRSISTFKLRAGMPIGLKVTLRGRRMYDFLLKLISIVLPRVRDFRGLKTASFDKAGNYSLGFEEQTIFPEISFDDIDKIRGLEVTVITTAHEKKLALRLLTLLGFPFAKGGENG